jgi:HlyD family type I secretion membrane fusion protein
MSQLPDLVRDDLPTLAPVPDTPPTSNWSRIGVLLIVVGLGGFLFWGSMFDLAGGAYASGMVRLSDEKQVIAHVEGGIIRRLNVKEGDNVTAGQELVVLDDYNSQTTLAILEKRRWELMARKARLEAVRDNWAEITFPDELSRSEATDVKEIMATQQRQFAAEKIELAGQKGILSQQTAQYKAIIDSLNIQIRATNEQLSLINQEVAGVQELLSKGLERRPRLLALQRNQAALRSQKADYEGRIASYNEKMGEIELQLSNLDADRRAKAVAELTTVEGELNQTNEQWANADVRSRELTLRATQDGTVLNLRYRSEGAVVPQGEPIMEIVPTNKVFVVDSRVSPMDIDVVSPGLAAQVRLSGLKQRTHVTLNGEVQRVSPDALQDERSGQAFFEARVAFDLEDPEFRKLLDNGELYAGMPADVVVVAHERTLLEYLIQPVTDSFARSFHED